MNIQEEAERRYPEPDQDRTGQQADRRSAFEEGAEWSRKEALEEAVYNLNTLRVNGQIFILADDAIEVVRVLMEETE